MNLGRDRGVNLVAFDDAWLDAGNAQASASGQHVAIVRLIRALGRDLGVDLIADSVTHNWTDRRIEREYSMLWTQIGADLDRDTHMAEKSERAYALRQGATFAAVGFGVGMVVGAVAHGIADVLNNGPSGIGIGNGSAVTAKAVSVPTAHPTASVPAPHASVVPAAPRYPEGIQPVKIVRGHWFDNGTPHRFE